MRGFVLEDRHFVSKPFSIGLALLFVGLQIASLFHGASHGFVAHTHAPKTIVAFDTPVFDVFGYDVPDGSNERTPDGFCDLDVYCDKLDKLVIAPAILSDNQRFDLDDDSVGRAAHDGATWLKSAARGPPSFLPS